MSEPRHPYAHASCSRHRCSQPHCQPSPGFSAPASSGIQFFLAFAFVVTAGAVFETGRGRLGSTLSTLDGWSTLGKLLGTIPLLGVVWLFAAVLESQTRAITQCFEGYWPKFVFQAIPDQALHRAVQRAPAQAAPSRVLLALSAVERQGHADPAREHPARLGGICRRSLRNAWAARLAPALSAAARCNDHADRRLAGGAGVSARPRRPGGDIRGRLGDLSACGGGPGRLYLVCVLVSGAIAVLAYTASLATARTYGEYVRTAFDLYRWKVLQTMNLPLPANAAEERARWRECGDCWSRTTGWPAISPTRQRGRDRPSARMKDWIGRRVKWILSRSLTAWLGVLSVVVAGLGGLYL